MLADPDVRLESRADVRALLRIRRPLRTVPEAVVTEGPVRLHALAGHDDDTVPDDVALRRLTLRAPTGEAVPCLLLTPGGPGPWPGVVAIHQHNGEFELGKSEPAGLAGDPSKAYAVPVARRGAAVLVPDLMGFEDRRDPAVDGGTGQRLAAFRLLVEGTTLQARHVEDVALCVTWLEESADVVGPIGLIGHSLGGQVAFFAAACDERVAAAVISCGLGTVESFHQARVLHNPAWYVPDLLRAGDATAVAGVTSGQSFLVCAGEADPLFPMPGVRDAVAGFPDGVADLRVLTGGHDFPQPLRDESAAWLVARLARARRAKPDVPR